MDGLLAELPAILDSFSPVPQVITYRGGWSGVVGSHKVVGKHTLCSYTCFIDPLVLEMAQKVVKLVDTITIRLCETSQLVAFVELPAEMTEYKPGIHGNLTCLRKQPQEKQTGELLATMHAHMDCLMMYP